MNRSRHLICLRRRPSARLPAADPVLLSMKLSRVASFSPCPSPRPGGQSPRLRVSASPRLYAPARAFTLIELLIAMAMVAVLMTVAIPSVYRNLHPDSMRKAVSEVMEVCAHARARAVLGGVPMELRIRLMDRSFSVATASVQRDLDEPAAATGNAFMFRGDEVVTKASVRSPAATEEGRASTHLSDRIHIEGLGVNGEDWTEDEEARVRFYPNGTCDEMSLILLSDKGERVNITLEVVTGLADMETDILKFKAR